MPDYTKDREWSDQFIPHIKQIVGPFLLEVSSFEVDTKQAADLIVLQAASVTIACRVRRRGYADKYPNQFTLRYRRDNGAATEYQKICNGFGTWMFYGHAGEKHGVVDSWMLINLNHFRAQLINSESRKQIVFGDMPNGDGTHFRWFDASSFCRTPPVLIATSQGVINDDKAA